MTYAMFNKYPNPFSSHVLGSDVVERKIDQHKILTVRLHLKQGVMPRFAAKLLNGNRAYVVEESVLDMKNKVMYITTKNLDHKRFLFVEETQELRPHPTKPSYTQITTTAKITSSITFLKSKIENFGMRRFVEHLQKVLKSNKRVGKDLTEFVLLINKMEKTVLPNNSPQFAYLEYFLQLSLKSSTAQITSAHALSNPHNTVNFEKRCRGILTLDAWLDPAQFPAGNQEDEVIRRGFVFNQAQGVRVSVGCIEHKEKVNRRVLLCKIGIGRAFPAIETELEVPDGYDSLLLIDDDLDKKTHTYYVNNQTQILPMYLVNYEFDPEHEKRSRQKPICDNCEETNADVYCAADAACLCKACDKLLHSANKLASRHCRTPIGKGADVFGACNLHPDKLVEFFCSQCHTPVCVHCKMVGHHSSGDSARHKLVSVQEAYQSVLAESQQPDNVLCSRKQAITNQLSLLENRASSLEKHASSVQQQIEEMYKKAMNELKIITNRKMDILQGDKWELIRQLDEINCLEDFLQYQQSGDSTHFLFSWARHQQMRQELHEFKFFRDSIDVQLDIKCTGNISVLIENIGSPAKRYFSPKRTDEKLCRKHIYSRQSRVEPSFLSEALGSLDEMDKFSIPDQIDFNFVDGDGYISD